MSKIINTESQQNLARDLVKFFNMPEGTFEFSIHAKTNDIMTIDCKFHVTKDNHFSTEHKKYEVVLEEIEKEKYW